MANVSTAMVIMAWLIFAMLAVNPATFRDGWRRFRGLPPALQGIGWLLFLPWVVAAGLWHGQHCRPLRLAAVVAIAAATVWVSIRLTA